MYKVYNAFLTKIKTCSWLRARTQQNKKQLGIPCQPCGRGLHVLLWCELTLLEATGWVCVGGLVWQKWGVAAEDGRSIDTNRNADGRSDRHTPLKKQD